MRVFQCREDPVNEIRRMVRRSGAETKRNLFERLAAHELHHDQQVGLRSKQLVDGGDFRVVEFRQRGRFRPKAVDDFGVGELGVEDLDGDLALEGQIERLVDGAHPSPSELTDDAVLADRLPDHVFGNL